VLRIALADDQALIRHGLKALLETLGGIQVVVEADNGDSLLDALTGHEVDAVLTDIRMPGRSGIGVLKALRQRGNLVPVILLTTFDDPQALKEGISAGASGYLLKDVQPETLKQVLESVVRGQRIFQPGPAIAAGSQPWNLAAGLTVQEAAILRLVAGGYSNKEVARQLGIAMGTVKNHISDILRKLGARDRTHAVLKAIAGHLLSKEEPANVGFSNSSPDRS
jgi:DNA-binding NarL/FixJ family response regulator